MKYLFVILAVAAAIIWYQRIQRDLATWQTSVQSLVAATHPGEGMAASPEDQATLVALLEHKPYRLSLTADEKELLAHARRADAANVAPSARNSPASVRPSAQRAAPPVPLVPQRTPTPQEVAAEIERKYKR